ncbi:hypothetical protein ONZ45_g4801 [Pleurotus djamor]|nr:hypothetical protein ONZ45_g4801 [Pleurotus djamor]
MRLTALVFFVLAILLNITKSQSHVTAFGDMLASEPLHREDPQTSQNQSQNQNFSEPSSSSSSQPICPGVPVPVPSPIFSTTSAVTVPLSRFLSSVLIIVAGVLHNHVPCDPTTDNKNTPLFCVSTGEGESAVYTLNMTTEKFVVQLNRDGSLTMFEGMSNITYKE